MDSSITQLLGRWKHGDRSVENDLIASLYPALREIAAGQARRHQGLLTLKPTELAHEAYLKLVDQQSVDWQNRDHFLAVAATVVRRVLVDYVRARTTEKRGGNVPSMPLHELTDALLPLPDAETDWVSLDQALTELEVQHPDIARVVELKFFGGLGVDQIVAIMGSSSATVGRQWRFARAWLAEQLGVVAE